MSDSKVSVTITNRAPGIQPTLYVAGSFSDPSWVPEPMEHSVGDDGVYTFTKNIRVDPHSKIQYKFRAGENHWFHNEDAPSLSDEFGNKNNVIEAPGIAKTGAHIFEEQAASSETIENFTLQASEGTADFAPGCDLSQDILIQPQSGTKTDGDAVNAQLFSHIDALKQSEHIHRPELSTLEVVNEIVDSAAFFNDPTPKPVPGPTYDVLSNITTKEAEQVPASSTIATDPADTNAEVTDIAGTSDAQNVGRGAHYEHQSPFPKHEQRPAEVAAEIADAAAILDAEKPEIHGEVPTPGYKSLTDVKAGMRDEALDITGYSDDPEPVPLFAHECAGLFEDDEIPGADDLHERHQSINDLLGRSDDRSFDVSTLEKFPITRDEITSTVQKVETGLNMDPTYNKDVPPSPVFRPSHSNSHSDHGDREPGQIPAPGRQTLSFSPPLSRSSTGERSLSAAILHSITEQAKGGENEKEDSAAKDVAVDPLTEQIRAVDEVIQIAQELDIAQHKDKEPALGNTRNTLSLAGPFYAYESDQTTVKKSMPGAGDKSNVAKEAPSTTLASQPSAEEVATAVVTVVPLEIEELDNVTEQTVTRFEHIQPSAKVNDDKNEAVSTAENITSNVEEAATADEAMQIAREAQGGTNLLPLKQILEPVPNPSAKPTTGLISQICDEDEAVVPKYSKGKEKETGFDTKQSGYLTPKRAATPQPEEPGSPMELSPNTAKAVEDGKTDKYAPKTAAFTSKGPHVVLSEPAGKRLEAQIIPDPALAEDGSESLASSGDHMKDCAEDLVKPRDTELSHSAEASKDATKMPSISGTQPKIPSDSPDSISFAIEKSNAGTLKKRLVVEPDRRDRSTTPKPIPETHRNADNNGFWLTAFIRLIFVDFVGGFIGRLIGGRHKAK